MKTTDSSFDVYTNSPTLAQQDWMRNHFWRMRVYSTYWDSKLSWYPNGWVYIDLYAIYAGSALATQHPEWILKDAGGNKLYIPWGCSNGSCPQYAADTSNPAFRQWWITQAQSLVAKGYKGLFVDDVNMEFRISNGFGNFVNPIDPNTGATMTWDNWRLYMAQFTELIKASFPNTEILHNSIWYAGPSGVRDLDPYIQRQIKAADYLEIESGVNDSGLTGGTGVWSLNAVLAYIDRLHSAGKGVVISGVPVDPVSEEYSLANFYLVSNGLDSLGNTGTTPDNWWSGFDTNLGTPSGARTTWNGLLRRDFSGGIALVNPPQAATITVNLAGTYKRLDGTLVTSVTLGAKQGAVLLLTGSTPAPGDSTAPTVSATSPKAGSTVSGMVSVTASAADNVGVTTVEFYVDNALKASMPSQPYAFSWNTTAYSNGAHTITAKAYDAAHNSATSSPVQVMVQNTVADTTPPTVQITAPNGGQASQGPITLAASAQDNRGVAGVTFYVDGVQVGSEVTSAPYTTVWNSVKHRHSITAVARDAAGNKATSAAVMVNVH